MAFGERPAKVAKAPVEPRPRLDGRLALMKIPTSLPKLPTAL